jgi:branched-chain amino acid transport system ATP-binding protein
MTANPMGEPLLSVRNLEVGYGDAGLSIRGVSLEVPAGGVVALLGANGAGKTTTIRAISGLLAPHRGAIRGGDIRFEGASIRRLRSSQVVSRGIAHVPEGRLLFPSLTVQENLLAGASQRRGAGVDASLEQVFDLFPVLRDRRRGHAGWLSGGEQQMVAIGRALMAAPRLLLVDELSLGLAPLVTQGIVERLRQAQRELGMATLIVEQNARLALEFADYAYILESGRIVLEGASAELRDDPQVREAYLRVGPRDTVAAGSAARRWWL